MIRWALCVVRGRRVDCGTSMSFENRLRYSTCGPMEDRLPVRIHFSGRSNSESVTHHAFSPFP